MTLRKSKKQSPKDPAKVKNDPKITMWREKMEENIDNIKKIVDDMRECDKILRYNLNKLSKQNSEIKDIYDKPKKTTEKCRILFNMNKNLGLCIDTTKTNRKQLKDIVRKINSSLKNINIKYEKLDAYVKTNNLRMFNEREAINRIIEQKYSVEYILTDINRTIEKSKDTINEAEETHKYITKFLKTFCIHEEAHMDKILSDIEKEKKEKKEKKEEKEEEEKKGKINTPLQYAVQEIHLLITRDMPPPKDNYLMKIYIDIINCANDTTKPYESKDNCPENAEKFVTEMIEYLIDYYPVAKGKHKDYKSIHIVVDQLKKIKRRNEVIPLINDYLINNANVKITKKQGTLSKFLFIILSIILSIVLLITGLYFLGVFIAYVIASKKNEPDVQDKAVYSWFYILAVY